MIIKPKVLIVAHENLPIPNVLGGAVEKLIQYIVEENEINGKVDLTVTSIYNKKAYNESKKFLNTRFIYINPNYRPASFRKIIWYINAFRAKFMKLTRMSTSYTKKVCQVIKEGGYDIVVFENNMQFINVSLPHVNSTYFLHLHNDVLNVENAKKYRNSIKKGILQLSGVICVSNYIESRVKESLPLTKTIVLPNGIRSADFSNQFTMALRSKVRSQYNIPVDGVVYLFTGRVTEGKGVRELIIAFNEIEDKSSYLFIVGGSNFSSTEVTPYIKDLYEQSQLNSHIIFTGYIDSRQISMYYAAADVVLIPSTTHIEASPLSALEAIMSRKPIIISDSGGLNDWENSEFAIVVKRDIDFIKNLSAAMRSMNRDKIAKMTQNMDSIIKERDVVKYYENFIKKVVNAQ